MFLITPPVLKFLFFNKIMYFQFFLFLIMSHQSQNHEILAIKSNLIKSNGILWDPSDFSNQISSTPMESSGIHWVLTIKSHQTQWNLMGTMRFKQSNFINHNGILWDPWDFSNQISANPMESNLVHEILAISSNPMESYGNPWDFSNQISSNPVESYGIHGVLAIKPHQIHWNVMGSITF